MSVDKAKKMDAEANDLATSRFPPWGLKEKKEDAIELWKKAAAIFKVSKEWRAAARCYQRAADTAVLIKAELEACNNWGEAGKALKNLDAAGEKEAIPLLTLCAKAHIEHNRMVMGGKVYRQIAEMEEKLGRLKEAMAAYELAAEIFYTSDMGSDGHACTVKVAEYEAGVTGNYKKAIDAYEKVIEASLENKLLAYGVKGYMFHALLCKFAELVKQKHTSPGDAITDVLGRYADQHPALDGSPEAKFVAQLAKSYTDNKYDDCVNAINTRHRIYKLTPLQFALCDIIKRGHPGQVVTAGSGGAGAGAGGDKKASAAAADGDDDFLQGSGDTVNLQAGGPVRAKPAATATAAAGTSSAGDAKSAPKQTPSAANIASGAGGSGSQPAGSAAVSASAAYAAAATASASPAPVASAVPAPTAAPAPAAAAAPAPAAAGDEPNMM